MIQSDRKIVEAFKAFFDKFLAPVLKSHPQILVQWKNLTSIVSSQPFQSTKLDQYISNLTPERTSLFTKPFSYQNNSYSLSEKKQTEHKYSRKQIFQDSKTQEYTNHKHYRLRESVPEIALINDGSLSPPYHVGQTNFREMSREKPSDDSKKKLLSTLDILQNLLSTNQYKLENDFKKDKKNIMREYEDRKLI